MEGLRRDFLQCTGSWKRVFLIHCSELGYLWYVPGLRQEYHVMVLGKPGFSDGDYDFDGSFLPWFWY
jgi:hypothetical protein